MSDAPPPVRASLACADLGFACEWRLRVASADEAERRFREHAKCAHPSVEVSAELVARVRTVTRAA